jgi:hypothetical protein
LRRGGVLSAWETPTARALCVNLQMTRDRSRMKDAQANILYALLHGDLLSSPQTEHGDEANCSVPMPRATSLEVPTCQGAKESSSRLLSPQRRSRVP